MKLISALAAVMATASVLAGEPVLSDVVVSRAPGSCRAKVSYRLGGGDAIVTATVCTNEATGACLDVARMTKFVGSVNRLVKAQDGLQTFYWDPAEEFADDLSQVPTDFTIRLTAWSPENPPAVMVLELGVVRKPVCFYPSMEALPDGGLANDKYRKTHLVMKRIRAAGKSFTMGSWESQANRGADETAHLVTLTNDFYIGIYPLTCDQYKNWIGEYCCANRQMPNFEMFPCNELSYDLLRGSTAENVNWPVTGAAVAETSLMARFRARTGLRRLDLPTEAEWEFAARGGTPFALYNGGNNSNKGVAEQIAWSYYNSTYAEYPGRSCAQCFHPVGEKPANDYGLFDMLGNSYEWCLDWYGAYGDATTAPVGARTGSERVMRGGAYCCDWTQTTCSIRFKFAPSTATQSGAGGYGDAMGARLACPIPLAFE